MSDSLQPHGPWPARLPPVGFLKQESFFPPADLPDVGIKPVSLTPWQDFLPLSPTWEAPCGYHPQRPSLDEHKQGAPSHTSPLSNKRHSPAFFLPPPGPCSWPESAQGPGSAQGHSKPGLGSPSPTWSLPRSRAPLLPHRLSSIPRAGGPVLPSRPSSLLENRKPPQCVMSIKTKMHPD